MAGKSAAGAIVSQTCWNGGWLDYGTTAKYCGSNYEMYYVYILQFTTPEFIGASSRLAFSLDAGSGTSVEVPLRYALCVSDANRDSYLNTNAEVEDANQLVQGTVTFANADDWAKQKILEIPCTGLKPSTAYYLILWAYNDKENRAYCTIGDTTDHMVSLNFYTGAVRIGPEKRRYLCAIGQPDGTKRLYLPCVYDAASGKWKLQS